MKRLLLLLFVFVALTISNVNAQTANVPTTGSANYTVCNTATIYDGGGTGNYNNNWNGTLVIYPNSSSNRISVSGSTSGMETCCDWVRIFNGVGTGGTLLGGPYTGGVAIPTLTSTDATGAITVQFFSDVSVVGAGFSLTATNNGTAPANPSFGTNTWNVLCYLNTDLNLGGAFRGYYPQNIDGNATYGYGFNTELAWTKATSPSCNSGYIGNYVPNDAFTFVHKRQGFPCGMYDITVEKWDDDSQLYIDGIRIYNASFGGSTTAGNIAVGPYYLLSTSTIEFRTQEGGGDAHAGVKIMTRATSSALSLSNSVTNTCSGSSNGSINATLANGLTGAKKLRITQLKNDFMNIAEIRAFELFTGTNVALTSNGGTAAQSVVYDATNYPASELINNVANVSGDMCHSTSGVGQWFEITFNTPRNIDRVEIQNRSDCCWDRQSALRLELYDNAGTLIYSKVIDAHQGNNNGTFVATFNIMDYTWSNSATTEDLSGLAAGSYTLTVSDVRCGNTTTTGVVGTNALPQVSAFSGNTICAGGTGTFTITGTGGNFTNAVISGTNYPGPITSGAAFNASSTPGSTTNYTLTSITSSAGCVRTTGFTDAAATITINPLPQGSFTGNTICGDGNETGQLTWTASAGTGPYTVNWTTASLNYRDYVAGSNYSTSNGSVSSGTPFNIVYAPVVNTTYTVTQVQDANGCIRSSGFTSSNGTITVTDPFPSPTLTNIAAGSIPGYSPPGAVGATWGNNGATGATVGYNATTWPTCTSYGFARPSINASANAYNPLELSLIDATNTNLATGKACFVGTSTFYYQNTSGVATSSVWPVRFRIIMGGSKPLQYVPSLNSLMTKANANFNVQFVMECYPPSGVNGVTGGSWQAAITVFNAMHAPSSGAGSTIYSNIYPALTSSGAAVSLTNTNFFNFSAGTITATANNPCIAYASGGVPNGGALILTGTTGTLNNTTCGTLKYLWSSTASPLSNTTSNPSTIVSGATSAYLTTYTYTVSSETDRVCYGTSTTATVVENTASPTTWNSAPTNGVTATNTAGADNWYTHSNWSNCVPCNNTSPACSKQAVINTGATNYPNINTGTAKAASVLHNGTPNLITIAAPTATLKLITP